MSRQQAKNALVASLFELSSAATNAATATVDFYKQFGLEGSDNAGSLLSELSASIAGAADKVASTLTAANGAATPQKRGLKKKVDFQKANGSDESKSDPETNAAKLATSAQATKAASRSKSKTGDEATDEKSGDEKNMESPAASQEVPELEETPIKGSKPGKVEKPKKKRAEKDPNAPKKPLTSYLRFNLQIRDSLRKARAENGQPTFQATELNQIIADKWANLTNEDKARLQQEYDFEYEVYKKALEEYKLQKQLDSAAVADTDTEETATEKASTNSAGKPKSSPAGKENGSPVKKATVAPANWANAASAETKEDKTAGKPETKSEANNDSAQSRDSAPKSHAKQEKEAKASVPGAAPSSDAPSEDSPAKKARKRKERDCDDKKLKKKKND